MFIDRELCSPVRPLVDKNRFTLPRFPLVFLVYFLLRIFIGKTVYELFPLDPGCSVDQIKVYMIWTNRTLLAYLLIYCRILCFLAFKNSLFNASEQPVLISSITNALHAKCLTKSLCMDQSHPLFFSTQQGRLEWCINNYVTHWMVLAHMLNCSSRNKESHLYSSNRSRTNIAISTLVPPSPLFLSLLYNFLTFWK